MTEVEKMRSSRLADMAVPEIQERFAHAKALLARMGGMSTYEDGYRKLLEELVPGIPETSIICPPFHCDHGDSVDTLAKTNAKRVSLRGTVDLTDLTGIRDQVTVDGITSFLFGGDINQLLRQLSDGNILDIHISEPDLEEIFLHYYEKDGDRV